MFSLRESILARGYVLLDTLPHDQIIPFVQKWLKKTTVASASYIAINLALLGSILLMVYSTPLEMTEITSSFGLGFFLGFLLIPIHECVHGIAYKFLGAKKVIYRANLKTFLFYAIADNFVLNGNRFKFVAIAPFAVITTLLILATSISNTSGTFIIMGALLLHTGACSGDFGIISYLDYYKNQDVLTYDDLSANETYFYGRQIPT